MANVESVVRGLEILRLLNVQTGQSLSELAKGCGLPRGTAYRMLFTLEDSGLIERKQNRYWITQRVRSLSHGFDNDWACEVAGPIVRALGRSLHWPVTLSEQSGSCALVRETTDAESSLGFDATKPGYRMSMLDTASGRVLLAYASNLKRRTVLDYLKCQPNRISSFARVCCNEFDEIGGLIRSRGYDVMPVVNGKQIAIAVPVMDATGHAVAALAVRYFGSSMKPAEALRELLAPLKTSAGAISDSLLERQGAVH